MGGGGGAGRCSQTTRALATALGAGGGCVSGLQAQVSQHKDAQSLQVSRVSCVVTQPLSPS